MKNVLGITAALVAVSVAGSAFAAPTATQQVSVNGSMADTCTVGQPTVVGAATNASLAGNIVTVQQLASDADALLVPTTITLNLDVMCNNAGYLTITEANGGLVRSGGVGPTVPGQENNFVRKIGYNLETEWEGLAALGKNRSRPHNGSGFLTGGAPLPIAYLTWGAAHANAEVKFTIPADSRPVLAGDYSTTVRVRAQSSL